MTAIGELSLWIALLMAVWAIAASFSGRILGRADLAESGRRALAVTSGMLVVALMGLIAAFVTRDFTRAYVVAHSSSNLPLAYTIAAAWSGSAGWTMMVSAAVAVFATIVTRNRGARVILEPAGKIAAAGFCVLIPLIAICIANPFAQLDFAVADGSGLPALQQSVGFVLVPPIEALALAAVTVACMVARPAEDSRGRTDQVWRFAALLALVAVTLRAWWTYTTLEGAHFWRWDLGSGAVLALWLMVASILHHGDVRRRSDSREPSPLWIGLTVLLIMAVVAFGGPFNMDAEPSKADPWLRFFASAGILVGAGLSELRSRSGDNALADGTEASSPALAKLLVPAYLGWLVTLALSAIVAGAVLIPILDGWMHEAPTSSAELVSFLLWIGAALVLTTTVASIRRPTTRVRAAMLGRWLLHGGIVVVVLGLSFATLTTERERTVRSGESLEVRDPFGRTWKLVGQGMSLYDVLNRRIIAVTLEAFRDGASKGLVKTEKRQIVDERGESLGEPITGVGFLRSGLLDLRVEMTDASGEVAKVRLTFVPLAIMVWLGAALSFLGALMALIFSRGGPE